MASDEYVRQLESDLNRERVARRIVDAALRDLMIEREALKEEVKKLKAKL